MQKIYGSQSSDDLHHAGPLWTAFGSVFALLLGYSRIPFAAAQSGYFFRVFGRLHPTKDFPYVSLLVLGAISIVAGFFSLGTVIDALIVTRILVQFMGQVVGLMLLRRHAPEMPRPYRMWLYPLPALVAVLGWIFVFATTQLRVIAFGVGMLALGCVAFLLWSWRTDRWWPFGSWRRLNRSAPILRKSLQLNAHHWRNEMVRKIVYWGSTALVSLALLGSLTYLTGSEQVVAGFAKAGYPQHLRIVLGIAKPVAAIVLLLPGFALLKEWAYAVSRSL